MNPPKYKVIAPYPDSPFRIGEILELKINPYTGLKSKNYYRVVDSKGTLRNNLFFDKYPNIFKRIE